MIKIRRGLDLPIAGKPEQVVHDGPVIGQVAVVGFDYPGMKPPWPCAKVIASNWVNCCLLIKRLSV